MSLKVYQPGRTEFLINTEWGIPREQYSKEEAKQKDLVLFKGRWVSRYEKKRLRAELNAYHGLRTVAVLLFISALFGIYVFIYKVAMAENFTGDYTIPAIYLLSGMAAFASGIGVWKFRQWGRIMATILFVLSILSPISILCIYYLHRKRAREIFYPGLEEIWNEKTGELV
jgi:hypothetical protein